MIYMFIILGSLVFLFIYHIYLKLLPNPVLYRVVYFLPTKKPIGIIIKTSEKTRFYYYNEDLYNRGDGLNLTGLKRFLTTIKQKAITNEIEFEKFESYFSDNFYISKITPIIVFYKYRIANDLLKTYQNNILNLES